VEDLLLKSLYIAGGEKKCFHFSQVTSYKPRKVLLKWTVYIREQGWPAG
jgi:hypothetical protein